jgi:hypothetical protein
VFCADFCGGPLKQPLRGSRQGETVTRIVGARQSGRLGLACEAALLSDASVLKRPQRAVSDGISHANTLAHTRTLGNLERPAPFAVAVARPWRHAGNISDVTAEDGLLAGECFKILAVDIVGRFEALRTLWRGLRHRASNNERRNERRDEIVLALTKPHRRHSLPRVEVSRTNLSQTGFISQAGNREDRSCNRRCAGGMEPLGTELSPQRPVAVVAWNTCRQSRRGLSGRIVRRAVFAP